MIKIVSLVLLFLSSGYLGFQISKIFEEKQNFYLDLLDFTNCVKNEIAFVKTDILTILNKYHYKSNFNDFLNEYKFMLESKNVGKERLLKMLDDISNFDDVEKNCIAQMFFDLGNIGYYEQLENLNFCAENYKQSLEKSRDKSLKFIPLSKKMGFLVGLLICIILI